MPKNAVVVPLDGSKGAEKAIPVAAKLAGAYNAPVALVHVIDGDLIESDEGYARATDVFARYASEAAERHGLTAPCTILRGSPSRKILEFAADARCIVIGSHGRGGFRATVIGSVADKVVRGASIPVFVVPVGGSIELDGRPIIVGLDGSKAAETGLAAARELAAAFGSQVVAVRAYSFPTPATIEFGYYAPDLADSVRVAAEDYLRSVARPGELTLTVLGPPDSAVLEAARLQEADVIVLTSHGKGLAGRIALGSTTDRVMHAAERILLILPIKSAS